MMCLLFGIKIISDNEVLGEMYDVTVGVDLQVFVLEALSELGKVAE